MVFLAATPVSLAQEPNPFHKITTISKKIEVARILATLIQTKGIDALEDNIKGELSDPNSQLYGALNKNFSGMTACGPMGFFVPASTSSQHVLLGFKLALPKYRA